MIETANQYIATHALAIKNIKITQPSGREFRVSQGAVFLTSQNVADRAAREGLVRAINPVADVDAPVEGDKRLFDRHGANFFRLAYDNASLAVRIELFKEPAPSIIINAFERPAPSPPAPITGFEFPS
jgi:hypothetical protein